MAQEWLISWGMLFFIIGVIRTLFVLIKRGSSSSGSGGGGEDGGGGTSPSPGPSPNPEPNPEPSPNPNPVPPNPTPDVEPVGLDNKHPGRIRFLVTNADDNPIKGAKIKAYAIDMPRWRRLFNARTNALMIYNGVTGPDGLSPSRPKYYLIGSGIITVKVKSKLGNAETDAIVLPYEKYKDVQIIHITINRRGAKSVPFEPRINNIRVDDDSLYLEGVVK
jgi:hypothetical protein